MHYLRCSVYTILKTKNEKKITIFSPILLTDHFVMEFLMGVGIFDISQ